MSDSRLTFHGVVTDDRKVPIEGATVTLFACYRPGMEKSLGSTCTDREGSYLISVPEPPEPEKLAGYRVRAVKALRSGEAPGSPQANGMPYPVTAATRGSQDSPARGPDPSTCAGGETPGRPAAPARRRRALVVGAGGRLGGSRLIRR